MAQTAPTNLDSELNARAVVITGYADASGGMHAGPPPTTVTGGGDASAANQTAVQANAGAQASKANAVQGITGGVPIPVSFSGGGDASAANQATQITAEQAIQAASGAPTDAAASSTVAETATARTGIGLWKGIKNILILLEASITSLIALLPAALGAGGGLKVDGSGTALPVSGAVTATVSGTATVTGDGAIITGETVETGGSGMLGWLSSIRHQLASLVAGTALKAGTAYIGKTIVPTFSSADNLVRPANATPYAALQSLNCNVVITAMSYTGLVVTLTAANAFSVGDYITVAGVNSGFTVTNIDGNWICGVGTNATTVVFTVTVQPTGTTPQTATHGTIAKLMAFNVGDANGNGIILSEIRVTLPGVAMTGAIRAYLYTQQVGALVDQATFTVLIANYASRRDYYDLYPVAEGSGSDCTMATLRLWEVIKLDPADTHVFLRLESEAAGTPANAGIIYARLTGIQLGG